MDKVSFNFLTDQQARSLIRQELENFFSERPIIPLPLSTESKVVDLNGLIETRPFIGCKSTIYKKVASGEIPHAKAGKRLVFDLKVIDEWLLANQTRTNQEMEEATTAYFRSRSRSRRKR